MNQRHSTIVISLIATAASIFVLYAIQDSSHSNMTPPETAQMADTLPHPSPIFDAQEAISRSISMLPVGTQVLMSATRLVSSQTLHGQFLKATNSDWVASTPVWVVGLLASGLEEENLIEPPAFPVFDEYLDSTGRVKNKIVTTTVEYTDTMGITQTMAVSMNLREAGLESGYDTTNATTNVSTPIMPPVRGAFYAWDANGGLIMAKGLLFSQGSATPASSAEAIYTWTTLADIEALIDEPLPITVATPLP